MADQQEDRMTQTAAGIQPPADSPDQPKRHASRRRFLRLAAGCAASALPLAGHATMSASLAPRSLNLFNTHTGEEAAITYWMGGRYLKSGLSRLAMLLRDHRTGTTHVMDPILFDVVFQLTRLAGQSNVEVVSGYRSPQTNRMLRRTMRGVALHSYHTKGQAIDLRIPGVPLDDLWAMAVDIGKGGVGFYPDSNFVHVDTGPFRMW
jgi:uncharacterized protein YcbK (DUF882 family)